MTDRDLRISQRFLLLKAVALIGVSVRRDLILSRQTRLPTLVRFRLIERVILILNAFFHVVVIKTNKLGPVDHLLAQLLIWVPLIFSVGRYFGPHLVSEVGFVFFNHLFLEIIVLVCLFAFHNLVGIFVH